MMGKGLTRTLTVLILFAALCMVPAAAAAEGIMQHAYSKDELAKVRAWEKTWAGKKIDTSNVDQVKQYLPEGFYDVYKNPQKWGAPEGKTLYFTIRPYEFVQETDNYIAATKKYSPTVKTDADGVITNIRDIAGRPFPDPKTGFEMAWNFELQTKGDTYNYRKWSPNINPKSRTLRMADQENWELFFINRTELDPKPVIPDNPKGYRRGMFLHMYKPNEFLNTRMYTLRYIDQDKADDSYMWYNQFRRIRKVSTAQRTDSIDGSDLIYDDEYLWDGQMTRNTYTFKGKKDLLCSRHEGLGKEKTSYNDGQVCLNGVALERCQTLVVDAINKDPNYLYSKRVWYLDPETYYILWTDIYDQNGRYWKCFMNNTCPLKTELGDEKAVIVGTQYVDAQRVHGGIADSQRINQPKVSLEVSPNMFTISYLRKTY